MLITVIAIKKEAQAKCEFSALLRRRWHFVGVDHRMAPLELILRRQLVIDY